MPSEQVADGFDLQHGGLGGRFHGAQDVENPRLPRAALGHVAEQRVVVALVFDDVAAEEEDRLLEQALLEEVEDEQDAPGAAVAVGEGVDRLELVMQHGELHERVEAVLGGVDELLEIREQTAQPLRAIGRRVDDFAGRAVHEVRARDARARRRCRS